MMLPNLLALVPAILATMGVPVRLPDTDPLMVRSVSCAEDAIAVAESLPEAMRSTWTRLLYVFAWKEGMCLASPPGFNDAGAACGVMQTHTPEKIIAGATCSKVRASRQLGMRVGLQLMLEKAAECGTIGAGLTAYATYGVCPRNGWVLPLVRQRCKLAGVKCT